MLQMKYSFLLLLHVRLFNSFQKRDSESQDKNDLKETHKNYIIQIRHSLIRRLLKHLEQKNHGGNSGDNKKCTDVKYRQSMNTQSFNQIIDDKIQNHWNNTLKMPVLSRDEQGNYYRKDV
ncbi:MAG TPA: hypothetical protein VFD03_00155 [Clostridia bacterium]|nr:hypothetical protein [Clostridia bacterium]